MLYVQQTMLVMARPRSRSGRRGVFAERLRKARAARGLTQAQTSEELEVTRPTLALWETGGARPVGPALLYVELWIRAALGEPIDLPGHGGSSDGGNR